MAGATVLSGVLVDTQSSRSLAAMRAEGASRKFEEDKSMIASANAALASTMSTDKDLVAALTNKDPKLAAERIISIVHSTSYPGDLALLDSSGRMLYSTDNPKGGDMGAERSPLLEYVIKSQKESAVGGGISGVATFNAGRMTLTSVVAIRSGKKFIGMVTASQPLSSNFLSGMASKWLIENPDYKDIGIGVVPMGKAGEPVDVVMTPNLARSSFLNQLVMKGVAGLPQVVAPLGGPLLYLVPLVGSAESFSMEGRWWHAVSLPSYANSKTVEGVILFGSPIEDLRMHAAAMTAIAILLAILVGVIAIIMARGIGRAITRPMRIITYRVAELTQKRSALPPLEGLEGEWLELGEQIDTALSNMRNSMQSLRLQVNKQATEYENQNKDVQETTEQVTTLSKQISQHSRTNTELSKQVMAANRQTIFLQRKLDAVMQVSTEGYLILDQFGNVLGANPTFLNWMGATEGEIAGRTCFDLVKKPGEGRSDVKQGQAFAVHGGDPAEIINQFYPEGVIYNFQRDSAVEVLAHLQPIESDEATTQGYIMVLRDKSLRSEISHLRTEIVAMLADSIRTPLIQAESGWQSVMSNTQKLPPLVKEPLEALHEHYINLLGVTDSLLMIYSNFMPPMPQQPPRQEVVVNRLVADCLEEVAPLARDRQLGLDYKSVTGLPNLNVDKEILQGIVTQLLEKMIAITGPGGRVRVESVYKRQDMRIGVLSSGPALSESELSDMFVGFIEGKHDMDSYSTRLSMYLARNSVERLGGSIWAESDRGTAIYFTVNIG
jgi:signal transduction histidine kinase